MVLVVVAKCGHCDTRLFHLPVSSTGIFPKRKQTMGRSRGLKLAAIGLTLCVLAHRMPPFSPLRIKSLRTSLARKKKEREHLLHTCEGSETARLGRSCSTSYGWREIRFLLEQCLVCHVLVMTIENSNTSIISNFLTAKKPANMPNSWEG